MPQIGSPVFDAFPLVLGGNTFGWTADRDTSFDVLDSFVAEGGSFIDTADGYSHWASGNGGGESESMIGEWLASRDGLEDVQIATKVGTHPRFPGLSADNVAAAAEASLGRLGVDSIALYYAHDDDPSTPLEETVGAFGRLVEQGKVRHVGLSNYSPERVREWVAVSDGLGVPRPVALQPHYNLVAREPFESSYAPVAAETGLAVFPYWALAAGFLTGKYRTREEFASVPRAESVAKHFSEAGLRVLEVLRTIAASHGEEPAAVALAWLRSRPGITAPVASARTPRQLTTLVSGARLKLPAPDLRDLDEVSAQVLAGAGVPGEG